VTALLRLLLSLRTTLGLVAALVSLSAWGSVAIQRSPEAYATIERGVLLEWLRTEGVRNPGASWWVAGMIAVAGALALNTVGCAADRLLRAWRQRRLTARSASAHLAHLGFLLVLLAHLIGSVAGFRSDGHRAFGGQRLEVPQRPGWSWEVKQVSAEFAPQGYPTSVDATVAVAIDGRDAGRGELRVNHPLHTRGVALYLSNAEPTLRGWTLRLPDGRLALAEVGRPLPLPGGQLELRDWSRTQEGHLALLIRWAPQGGSPLEGWLSPRPGVPLPVPSLAGVVWGEIAVDTLGTFDVRYDPGAPLALAGAAVLSASLVPLLWPRRRVQTPPVVAADLSPPPEPT
jgi:hypothetical protein